MSARRAAYPAALGGLAILALALAFHGIGDKSLVLDESTSIAYSSRDLHYLWLVVSGGDPNGGLYYVLLKAWLWVFGDSETAARALTAVVAGLLAPAVALVGGRLFGRSAGLAAGLLLAVDGFFIHYAQTARAYLLAALLVTVSSYFFVAELQRPSRAHRLGFVVAASLAIYAHYFAGYVLLAQLLTLLAVRRRAALTRDWLIAVAGVAVLCAPEAAFAMRVDPARFDWIPDPGWRNLVDLPGTLVGGGSRLGWVLVGLGAYALLVGLRQPDRWRTGFVAAWFAVPVLVSFAVSFVQPMFISYYLLVSLPALVLLAAAGVMRLPGRVAGALALVGLVVLSVGGLSTWYRQPSPENYRAAAKHILRAMRPGDGIAYEPTWTATPIEYYVRQDGRVGPTPVELPAGAGGPAAARVWLVMRESDVDLREQARLEGRFAAAYELVPGQPHFRRVRVVLFRSRSGA